MAYSFGTATDLNDLFTKLVTFLTTDAALTGLGQNWTVMQTFAGSDTETHLRGPGTGGDSDIYVQLWQSFNPSAPYYNIGMRGSGGYAAGQRNADQPSPSPDVFFMLCSNTSMKYWFFADGRHFKTFVQVNTTYQNMFAGLLLPDGTAAEMPYPMFLGATVSSAVSQTANSTASTYNYASFWDPSGYANFRAVDGTWKRIRNHYENSGTYAVEASNAGVWPWSDSILQGVRECFSAGGGGGPYPIWQAILAVAAAQGGPNVHGYLPGVFWVPGFSQGSENTLTIGADTYLIFQSHKWTHRNAFCAIKVE